MGTNSSMRPTTRLAGAFNMIELIHVTAVRQLRKGHRNPVVGLMLEMMQSVIMIAGFMLMFVVIGIRTSPIRGDFVLYIMSGIFVFMTHVKSLGAVFGAESSTSAMMQHAPLNPIITISAAAIGALYMQTFALVLILVFYHTLVTPIEIYQPIHAYGMILLAWASGVAIGILFLSIRPWAPNAIVIIQQLYQRINMVASGKLFLANTLPPFMLKMFMWNPLFHTIDQARGYAFINYNPRVTSITYVLVAIVALFMIGMLAEFYTRKHASLSWSAGQ